MTGKYGHVYVVAGRTFTPLEAPPPAAAGLQASARTELVMQTRGSRFVKFQEVRIQELAAEVGTRLLLILTYLIACSSPVVVLGPPLPIRKQFL